MPSEVSIVGTDQGREPTVEELKRELAEAREHQAATNEILRVVQSSPRNVQPVFDAILQSAIRLCRGIQGTAVRFDGEFLHLAAHYGHTPEGLTALQNASPARLDQGLSTARAILTRSVVQIEDALDDPQYPQHIA